MYTFVGSVGLQQLTAHTISHQRTHTAVHTHTAIHTQPYTHSRTNTAAATATQPRPYAQRTFLFKTPSSKPLTLSASSRVNCCAIVRDPAHTQKHNTHALADASNDQGPCTHQIHNNFLRRSLHRSTRTNNYTHIQTCH